MDGLVVEADQNVPRETVHHARGGIRAIFSHHFATDFGELAGGDSRANAARHGSERESDDASDFPQTQQIVFILNRHSKSPRGNCEIALFVNRRPCN